MSREFSTFKRNENEEVTKPIKPDLATNELQESEESIQKEDSAEEEIPEDELMEIEDPIGKWKWVVVAAVGAIIIIAGIAAIVLAVYPKKEPQPVAIKQEVKEEEAVSEVVEEVAAQEQVEEEVIAEEAQEDIIEHEETVEEPYTIDDFIASLEIEEIQLYLWNSSDRQATLIQSNERYEYRKDDCIIIYKAEPIDSIYMSTNVNKNNVEKHDLYNILNIDFEGEVPYEVEIECKSGNFYKFTFDIVSK